MTLYDVFPFDSAAVDVKEALHLLNDLALPVGHHRRRLPADEMMQEAVRLLDRAVDGLARFGTDVVEDGEDAIAAHGPAACCAPSVIDADAVEASQALSAACVVLRQSWALAGASVLPKSAIAAVEAAFPGPFKERIAIEQSALDTF